MTGASPGNDGVPVILSEDEAADEALFPQDRVCPFSPPPGYAPLRNQRPLGRVTLHDGRSAWIVTENTTARALLTDSRLSVDRGRAGFPFPSAELAGNSRRGAPLIGTDGDRHNIQRRAVIPAFTHKRITALRPKIQRTVDRYLDRMTEKGPGAELVSEFALPVASTMICELLGVPHEDQDWLEEQSRRLLRGPLPDDGADARVQLEHYFDRLVDRKDAELGGGLLDAFVRRQVEGALDRGEVVGMAIVLLVAGHETTADMISLGTFALLQHSDLLEELLSDVGLFTTAVDELLRFLSVADGMLRVATESIDIAGQTIHPEEGVIFANSLINRDEGNYSDPDRLAWNRPTQNHLAFGHGIHQCLGQNLARAEMEIAFRSLFARLPGLRLAVPADRIPLKTGYTIQGVRSLPVTWSPPRP
ncbi:cytochrome P450 [Streptomyces sp. 8L]|uniref:cytochrome P450 n=1 Tax=Streptomyces sp. 8L TaxID=2877242 RepID=UPI001CD25DF1|nr:cytochrome P450 [Streptomyces sp. 8L]MCA1217122.1 cytochrome P450 [Streptomyces sp. 8L]